MLMPNVQLAREQSGTVSRDTQTYFKPRIRLAVRPAMHHGKRAGQSLRLGRIAIKHRIVLSPLL